MNKNGLQWLTTWPPKTPSRIFNAAAIKTGMASAAKSTVQYRMKPHYTTRFIDIQVHSKNLYYDCVCRNHITHTVIHVPLKMGNAMYQLYTHLYTKIGDTILILQEQASFERTYKKSACIGKHLYKLCTSHNKLRNECTSGRNSIIKLTRPRLSVVSCTRKPRRFCDARNR